MKVCIIARLQSVLFSRKSEAETKICVESVSAFYFSRVELSTVKGTKSERQEPGCYMIVEQKILRTMQSAGLPSQPALPLS